MSRLAPSDVPDLVGDLEILAGGDDERPDRGAGCPDLAIVAVATVARRVDLDAEEGEVARRPLADGRRVLPHPAGEDEDVEAAERRGHRGDRRAQPMVVDVEREDGVRLARIRRGEDRPHVGRARQAQQARAVLERGGELGRRHPHVLRQPQHEARIDAPGPGGHDQPVERA